ncbi:cupin domain-containing protein [Pontibacter rugosus]|uniref:Cupin domain-containing protein n=1 Tax=Pontibacter rugosus TaxID=1745966 RepID=A0ABW3SLL1_9BACT
MTQQTTSTYLLKANGALPNNPQLPVLVCEQVFQPNANLVNQFKQTFEQNNWRGTWVGGVFDYHHYHSTAHEVLGVAAGSAVILLGGPGAEEIEVKAGDMLILPAGTGHCLESSSADFKVVGAYPEGQENYDICTEDDDPKEQKENIAKVTLPESDPIAGANGPLLKHWHKPEQAL